MSEIEEEEKSGVGVRASDTTSLGGTAANMQSNSGEVSGGIPSESAAVASVSEDELARAVSSISEPVIDLLN